MYIADTYNQRIQKFDSSGNFLTKWGANGGDGTSGMAEGEFQEPEGIAIDASGNVYVADSHNRRLQKFDSSGNFISTFGWGVDDGSNELQTCTSDCQAGIQGSGDGQFNNPQIIDIDSNGNLILTDEDRIQKLDQAGNFISTFGWGVDDGSNELQTCTSDCQAGIQGSGDGQFNRPYGIVLDNNNNVYVADGENNRVQKLSSSGAFIAKWGANGGDGTSGAADGEFGYVRGITFDSTGNIYVADAGNNRIQKFDSSGQHLSTFGTFDYDDLVMTYGSLGLDSNENIYFANAGSFFDLPQNNSVKKYSREGQPLALWPTNDYTPYSVATSPTDIYVLLVDTQSQPPSFLIRKTDFNGNTITEWSINPEDGVGMFTVDGQDNVYIADGVNNRIVKRNGSTGTITDTFGEPGSGDGQLNLGETFVFLSADQSGNIFVTDTNNHRIQKFDSNGNFLMKFGSEGTGDGEFTELTGITIGNNGSIYVSDIYDESGGRIQKFDGNGNYVSQYVQQPDDLTWGFVPATMVAGSNGRIYTLNFMGGYRIEILCDNDVSTDGCTSTGDGENEVSLSSAENGTPIVLSQSGCSTVSSSSVSKESSNGAQDPGYSYPVGLVGFSLAGCGNGGTATVTVTFTGSYEPSSMVVRKYNTTTNAYTTLTQSNSNLQLSTTTLNDQPALQVQYQITDGGLLDQDNTVNGSIQDPVGIATQTTGAADTGVGYWVLRLK